MCLHKRTRACCNFASSIPPSFPHFQVLYDQPTGRLALVFELMDMNIYELIRGRRHYVAEERVKNYMYQLMRAMDHMHRNGIFHRDIKPENILIMDDCLKLADFGSCRGIYSKQPYTEYISTRYGSPRDTGKAVLEKPARSHVCPNTYTHTRISSCSRELLYTLRHVYSNSHTHAHTCSQ